MSEDLRTAAKLSAQGYRSFVWRGLASKQSSQWSIGPIGGPPGGDDGSQPHWEEFARMACNMVLAMKGLPPSQKEAQGLDLKTKLLARGLDPFALS